MEISVLIFTLIFATISYMHVYAHKIVVLHWTNSILFFYGKKALKNNNIYFADASKSVATNHKILKK